MHKDEKTCHYINFLIYYLYCLCLKTIQMEWNKIVKTETKYLFDYTELYFIVFWNFSNQKQYILGCCLQHYFEKVYGHGEIQVGPKLGPTWMQKDAQGDHDATFAWGIATVSASYL